MSPANEPPPVESIPAGTAVGTGAAVDSVAETVGVGVAVDSVADTVGDGVGFGV